MLSAILTSVSLTLAVVAQLFLDHLLTRTLLYIWQDTEQLRNICDAVSFWECDSPCAGEWVSDEITGYFESGLPDWIPSFAAAEASEAGLDLIQHVINFFDPDFTCDTIIKTGSEILNLGVHLASNCVVSFANCRAHSLGIMVQTLCRHCIAGLLLCNFPHHPWLSMLHMLLLHSGKAQATSCSASCVCMHTYAFCAWVVSVGSQGEMSLCEPKGQECEL